MEPERLLEKPLLHSGRPHRPDSPQPLAGLTAGGVQSKPAKNGARQGAPPLKEKKKGLLIVVCGIGEIPQPELLVKFYQRVYKAASQERSSLGEVTLPPFSSGHLIALTLLPPCWAFLIFLTGSGAAGESAGSPKSCGTNPRTQPKAIKLEVVR